VNSIDPVVLFFFLGIAAGISKSDLRLPASIYEFLSVFLLLAIGLKGGVELAAQPLGPLVPKMVLVVAIGVVLTLIAYPILRVMGRFKHADAASIAAHYGSVSVGTYAVAVAYLATRSIEYEPYLTLFLVLLEMPAIIVGVALARGITRQTQWSRLAHEILSGKSIVLLAGGLLIGWIAGPEGLDPIEPFFFDLFKGILALFLLEMGLLCAGQLGSLRQYGVFLAVFGVGMPLVGGLIGGGAGLLMGLSPGGTMLLVTLSASASYIAVPAAMRLAVPESNPTLSLAASLGVTFPFNVTIGIPIYLELARFLHGVEV